jgi:hypothetical protein
MSTVHETIIPKGLEEKTKRVGESTLLLLGRADSGDLDPRINPNEIGVLAMEQLILTIIEHAGTKRLTIGALMDGINEIWGYEEQTATPQEKRRHELVGAGLAKLFDNEVLGLIGPPPHAGSAIFDADSEIDVTMAFFDYNPYEHPGATAVLPNF